jgi:hypothetical protein
MKSGPFTAATLGTPTAYTQITPADLDGGIIAIAEQLHQNGDGGSSWAAWNLQAAGEFVSFDDRARFLPITRMQATRGIDGGPVVDVIEVTR